MQSIIGMIECENWMYARKRDVRPGARSMASIRSIRLEYDGLKASNDYIPSEFKDMSDLSHLSEDYTSDGLKTTA
jgi:hypothetical protein